MLIPKPYILIFISIFTSCKVTESNIAGRYSDYYNFENSADLTLNKDKTFSYIFQSGMIFSYNGKWRLSKDTLILYSNSNPLLQNSVTKQLINSSDVWVKILVNDDLDDPLPFEYYKDGKLEIVFDTLTIPFVDIPDTLRIEPFPFPSVLISKTDIKPGILQIKVFKNPNDYFEDMKFLVRNGKLKKIVGQKRTGFVLKSASSNQ